MEDDIERILSIISDEFIKMQQFVNSLLVNYSVHQELRKAGIDHKLKLGYYNDHELKQSYKHIWMEHNDKIYDLANYINDQLINVVPVHRTNAYLYHNHTKNNIYTYNPTYNRVDMNTNMDKDYDNILEHLYVTFIRDSCDNYLNEMPDAYKNIINSISNNT